jgi:hypothetical protein
MIATAFNDQSHVRPAQHVAWRACAIDKGEKDREVHREIRACTHTYAMRERQTDVIHTYPVIVVLNSKQHVRPEVGVVRVRQHVLFKLADEAAQWEIVCMPPRAS